MSYGRCDIGMHMTLTWINQKRFIRRLTTCGRCRLKKICVICEICGRFSKVLMWRVVNIRIIGPRFPGYPIYLPRKRLRMIRSGANDRQSIIICQNNVSGQRPPSTARTLVDALCRIDVARPVFANIIPIRALVVHENINGRTIRTAYI